MITDLTVGTEIYNNGDRQNEPHFGVITRIIEDERFGDQVEIEPREGRPYRVTPASFSSEYKGHSGTRFVTKAAYLAWKEQCLGQFLSGGQKPSTGQSAERWARKRQIGKVVANA